MVTPLNSSSKPRERIELISTAEGISYWEPELDGNLLILGGIGCGKTTLVRRLIAQISERSQIFLGGDISPREYGHLFDRVSTVESGRGTYGDVEPLLEFVRADISQRKIALELENEGDYRNLQFANSDTVYVIVENSSGLADVNLDQLASICRQNYDLGYRFVLTQAFRSSMGRAGLSRRPIDSAAATAGLSVKVSLTADRAVKGEILNRRTGTIHHFEKTVGELRGDC